ncbi:MAG: hypothetical protein A3G64_01165 [Candidatus Liptonbacteria bacterium RIFCSPLOWO2_12_FULL_60_15]|uniref:Uncharacterized protein n=1 Tax=Candidatus Liptonbacteria bacterium RIFCSPLOWO2_12_FULL_60_15 TaxID=1798653 RepID=A0A1G2CN98_9BACT|nr:MAG: hypothetical protein A3G64_01165 [Candidatus Liptonbacteria bacterium RIFCSPLOWO2_12_FULL_60_15]
MEETMDVLALLSYGWFERACLHCHRPTKERVRHMTMEIVGFHENHVWYGEKRPLHFACNTAKTGPDNGALRPVQIHNGKAFFFPFPLFGRHWRPVRRTDA